jgi:hypothetical protein
MDVISKYPKGEIVWVTYYRKDATFIITSKPTREIYYLYKVLTGGTLEKISKSKTPTDFTIKYGV